MALIGLRMMPTFPSSSLRFRTAGFPQYGSKASMTNGVFPNGLHPSLVATGILPRPKAQLSSPLCHRCASGSPALPQGSSLRSEFCCPGPSSLNRPHPPHWPTRCNCPALRVICAALAVRAPRPPRPSTTGSELSLTIPSQHVAPLLPGESAAGIGPAFSGEIRLRLVSPKARHSQFAHHHPLLVGGAFEAFWFTPSLRPAESLASLGGPDRAPDSFVPPPSQPRLLLPSLRPSRSPFSPSGITTVVPGRFHWQDFHLLEQQLASLHGDRRLLLGAERGSFVSAASETRDYKC
jgi:hypothetical protein